MTPFEAVTHAAPYTCYSQLRHQADLYFDTRLECWVASGATVIQAMLQHPDLLVRPCHEPVPPLIAQTPAGQVFGNLMRMNEGQRHQCPRAAIEPVLAAVPPAEIAALVAQLVKTDCSANSLNALMFTLPVSVLCRLMGFGAQQLPTVAALTRDFVACLSPLSNELQRRNADIAATRLSQMFNHLLKDEYAPGALLKAICSGARSDTQEDHDVLIANLIGLLSQTCEATAGLIGNTLVALQQDPELLEKVSRTPALIHELVTEVSRLDPSVQNTRRFVAKSCVIGNCTLKAGDRVLLLLASANRDPDINPDPDCLLLKRSQRQSFSFGHGRHQCPGQQLALVITSETIGALLKRQDSSSIRTLQWRYLSSLNGRIPRFGRQPEIAQ